ncbi:hypothetical protein AVEN_161720-1 [Araneus ventricosus]|uniref:Uncharacterized protein n=1 Tax=Araneus ventricosus TaxID=182803 RepID=A0A4Y2U6W2_ARAVE|nr:hypothetical protein AVEN_161720-1 [Araneus ventricosus]
MSLGWSQCEDKSCVSVISRQKGLHLYEFKVIHSSWLIIVHESLDSLQNFANEDLCLKTKVPKDCIFRGDVCVLIRHISLPSHFAPQRPSESEG